MKVSPRAVAVRVNEGHEPVRPGGMMTPGGNQGQFTFVTRVSLAARPCLPTVSISNLLQ